MGACVGAGVAGGVTDAEGVGESVGALEETVASVAVAAAEPEQAATKDATRIRVMNLPMCTLPLAPACAQAAASS